MLYFLCFMLTFISPLFAMLDREKLDKYEYSLAYVHVGSQLPGYLPTAIAQARLFNPECPIFLLASSEALSNYDCSVQNVIQVPIETLNIGPDHQHFIDHTELRDLWRYAIERFLYLNDFIQQYGLKNVFHTENDVMLYFDLSTKLPVFQKNYSGMIATVFDCDDRSVPSFVYISDPSPSAQFANYAATHGYRNTTDMELLGQFKDTNYKTLCDHLPILIPSYAQDHPLTNLFHKTARDPLRYSNHLDQFQVIFDAAALGQFLGGIDPILTNSKPGFIAELSVFLTYYFQYKWERDAEGRLIPYISYKNDTYPIANLHIHCKNLASFYSLNKEPLPIPTSFWSSLPLP